MARGSAARPVSPGQAADPVSWIAATVHILEGRMATDGAKLDMLVAEDFPAPPAAMDSDSCSVTCLMDLPPEPTDISINHSAVGWSPEVEISDASFPEGVVLPTFPVLVDDDSAIIDQLIYDIGHMKYCVDSFPNVDGQTAASPVFVESCADALLDDAGQVLASACKADSDADTFLDISGQAEPPCCVVDPRVYKQATILRCAESEAAVFSELKGKAWDTPRAG